MIQKRLSLILITFLISVSNLSYGQHDTDSLLKIVAAKNFDTAMVKAYAALGSKMITVDTVKALYYCASGKMLAEKLNYKAGIALCYNTFGDVYYYLDKYEKALENYKKATIIYYHLGDKSHYAYCLKNVGNVYANQSDYPLTIKYYQKALKIFETISDLNGISLCLNNIGAIFYVQGDLETAMQYFERSLKICSVTGDKHAMQLCYSNMGNIYREQKKYDIAIYYYNRSLEFAKKIGDIKEEAWSYYVIGITQNIMGNVGLAVQNLQKSLDIQKRVPDIQGMAYTYVELAGIYNKEKKYPLAIAYSENSLLLAEEVGSPDLKQSAHKSLAESYKGLGNFEVALEHYELFKQISDSIYNTDKTQQIAKMEAAYQSEAKQREIDIQKLQIAKQELDLNKSNLWLLVLILSIVLIIAIFTGIFLFYKVKHRTQMKAEILHRQEARTKAIIETQEDERKRIAQDLHDGIGHKLTAVKINFEQLRDNMQEVMPDKKMILEQTEKILDETHKELRALSHQMMPKALMEKELKYAVSDLMEDTFKNSKIKFSLMNDIPNDLHVNTGICIYRILQELLSNIIKHAQASEIAVQIYKNKNTLIVMVEDDGIGINNHDSTASGIGLNNIAGRVNALDGSFVIEPGPLKGTIATAKIPII